MSGMNVNWLLLSMLYSTVGLGMFMYGRKAVSFVPLVAGIALMVIPYFITSLLWMTIISLILMASPFVIRNMEM